MTLDDLRRRMALAPNGTEVVLLGFSDWLDIQKQHPGENGSVAPVDGIEIWHDVQLPPVGGLEFTTRAMVKFRNQTFKEPIKAAPGEKIGHWPVNNASTC